MAKDPPTKDSGIWSQWTREVRRGVLQLLVLAILRQKHSHGFEIVSTIRKLSGGLIDLPGGTIYPLLNRLEKNGLLEVFAWEHEGRKRKTYALTPKGQKACEQSLDYWQRLIVIVEELTGRLK
ncbi:MAG: PadR family transcriptional regulator [Candidatus Hodarchaeales archaeon]|jgi:DNA-binding PadR family transcriptional regulator